MNGKRNPWILLISFLFLQFTYSCATSDKTVIKTTSGTFAETITVSGRFLYRNEPIEGAKVLVYENVDDMVKDRPAKTALTDDDGNYTLTVPSGRYYFIALKENAYFSYSGRNPVAIRGDDDRCLGFQAEKVEKVDTTDYDDEFYSAISGRVLYKDIPVKDAFVTIFLDDSDEFKGPGYSIVSTDSNGEFFFDYLPESEYFILVRKRGSGEKVGPIYEGDLYAYFPGNPLYTQNSKTKNITINCVSKIDDENLEGKTLPKTGLSGTILDTDGNLVAGVHVFAYTDPVIGHKRPKALSFATKDDGRFVLELKEGGTYYVGAREKHGDSPEPGELFGMYEVTPDHSIKVDTDTFIQNITIVVEKIMQN